ncbi:MAG: helix-turn-helix transcriptional regulator [Oligoflexia bacterium]|nr:helix-turn-helix transcriptional regulator [Oligoflexia bacterium]
MSTKYPLSQGELKGLTQSEVSKIEGRKDLKLSTLNKYARAMGMKVKIVLTSEEDDMRPICIYG